MGSLSSAEQRKLAYFHALGKVMTEDTQAVYESMYKSSHNIKLSEIWANEVGYAINYIDAVSESLNNDAVTLHNQVILTSIPGSNNESYYYHDGTKHIRPWIASVDILDGVTNYPSFGYQVRLFRGSNATLGQPNTEIYLTEGAWSVDHYAGIIHFADGYTPTDLGWGTIKATFFQYSGQLADILLGGGGISSVDFDTNTTSLIFNSGTTGEMSVDLSYLDSSDAFSSADFNTNTSIVTFNKGQSEYLLDLSALKNTLSGTTSIMSPTNTNMVALTTSPSSLLACATSLLSGNLAGSLVCVYVNGVQISVGDGINNDCYFSNDGGITQRQAGSEQAGDYLYWRHINGKPVSGYELNTDTDKITFIYLTQ